MPTAGDAKNAEQAADALERTEGVLGRMMRGTSFSELPLFANPLSLGKHMFTVAKQMAVSLDKMNAEVAVSTGLADHYRGALEGVAVEQAAIGTSLDDVNKILQDYHKTFSLFPGMAKSAQKEFMKLGAVLDRVGVSAQAGGKAMDTLMRGLNMSLPDVREFWSTMNILSQEVGMGMERLSGEYAKALPWIMKYGSSHVRVYQEMTYAQRKFGLSQQEIVQVADQFDTFEGAATTVGILNSHLANYGVQLNDIAMGQMNEAERIEYLNTELRRAGVSFRDLGIREKQFFAKTMTQGDTDMLSRLMGDPQQLADYQKEMLTLDERAMKFTSSVERITAAFQKLVIDSGLLQAFEALLKRLSEYDLTSIGGILKAGASLLAAPVTVTNDMMKYAKAPTERMERKEIKYREGRGNASNVDSWRYTGDYFTDDTGDLMRFNTGDLHYLPGGATGGTRLDSPAFTTGKDRDAFIRAIKDGMREAMREATASRSQTRRTPQAVVLRVGDGQEFKAYIEAAAVTGITKNFAPIGG